MILKICCAVVMVLFQVSMPANAMQAPTPSVQNSAPSASVCLVVCDLKLLIDKIFTQGPLPRVHSAEDAALLAEDAAPRAKKGRVRMLKSAEPEQRIRPLARSLDAGQDDAAELLEQLSLDNSVDPVVQSHIKELEAIVKQHACTVQECTIVACHPVIYAAQRYCVIKRERRNQPCALDGLIVTVTNIFLRYRAATGREVDGVGKGLLHFAAMTNNVAWADAVLSQFSPKNMFNINAQTLNGNYVPLHAI